MNKTDHGEGLGGPEGTEKPISPRRSGKKTQAVERTSSHNNLTARTATTWIKDITVYAAGIGALVATLTLLQQRVSKLFPLCPPWLWIAAGSLPLFFTFVTHTLPAIFAKRCEHMLSEYGVRGPSVQPMYFRLGPYESTQEDQQHYARADGTQEAVLRWISKTPERILFLTGSSGVGKSSLLNAFVFPTSVTQRMAI